ncbi:hypothetical protein GHI93_11460 [Lactococcus hircilactis]|uniref:Uncharacterized protein n=1 Tax=Lactococcus hircilactis TaxID=1494462 RepID=A0A7X2D2K0_9LACT|nr:hypothetical protein [Lactococcus hircilactis]MQW40537.1 hypothetical protein [Lactococcus hircilactis]
MKKLFKSLLKAIAVVAALFSVSAVVNLAYHHYGDIAILVFMALVLIIWATVMFYCLD